MGTLITVIVALAAVLYLFLLLVECFRTQKRKSALIQLIALGAFVALLNNATGFPIPRISFGGVESHTVLAIMFVCIMVGIVSNYLFFAVTFDWKEFLRPLLISPLLLMPLYGLIEGSQAIERMKLISLCLVSYQSGFFWKVLFEKIAKSAKGEA